MAYSSSRLVYITLLLTLLSFFKTFGQKQDTYAQYLNNFPVMKGKFEYDYDTSMKYIFYDSIPIKKEFIEPYICNQFNFDCFNRFGYDTISHFAILRFSLNDSVDCVLYVRIFGNTNQHILDFFSKKTHFKMGSIVLFSRAGCYLVKSKMDKEGNIFSKIIIKKCSGMPDFKSEDYFRVIEIVQKYKIQSNGSILSIERIENRFIGINSDDPANCYVSYPVIPPKEVFFEEKKK